MPNLAQLSLLALSALVSLGPGLVQAEVESALTSEIGRLNNQSLLWGPYKPNLYFGVRPRIAKSLWAGLMWVKVDNFQDVGRTFRYTCEQHEGIHGYGWDEYDARHGGIQTIHDEENKIDISTTFLKVPGGAHGGSWAARIKGTPRSDAPVDLKSMVAYYIAQEDAGELEVETQGGNLGFSDEVTLTGKSESLGAYKLVITKGTGDRPECDHEISSRRRVDETTVRSLTLPVDQLWQAKQIVFQQLQEGLQVVQDSYDTESNPPPPWAVYQLENKPGSGNVHIVQKIFEGAFEFDVIFSSASAGKEITSEDVNREAKTTSEFFGQRFASVFNLKAPFNTEKYQKFGKSMFSNLLGGIGYFHGHHIVDRTYAAEYEEENEGFWEDAATARARKEYVIEGPYELFTSIPSRPFFPRGFLWDEGYHLIPIADWDLDLTLDVVKSWFSLMDDDGWIAREQILGPEARSKVPEEFQVQYPHYANPPTLFLIIEGFMERLKKTNGSQPAGKESLNQQMNLQSAHLDNPELGAEYLRRLYPLLRRQYDWFRKTQRGDIKSYDRNAFSTREAYRWRGRTETHCLTSGLDDYPRPQPPHPAELHVDLMSWMGFMTKSLMNIADSLGLAEDVQEYRTNLEAIGRNLHDLHWSENEGCFCDATVDAFEENALVCHKGYVSLFPLLVGLLAPDDPKVGRLLDLLGDEEELFSPHGLRSLSLKSEHYGTSENYWRSPIWVNINYMAITQLYNLALQDGPYKARARDLYSRLRRNVVETVYTSWEETGFAWEQYNPETGKGQRTQHFTGWTSLVVKIMAMDDLGAPGGGHAKDEL